MIEIKLSNEDVQRFIDKKQCPDNKHFPEYVYKWDLTEIEIEDKYCGHCAICGTDYTLKYKE